MPRHIFGSVGLALLLGANAAGQAEPDLTTVLRRATDYVDGYAKEFSRVIADEEYVQELRVAAKYQSSGGTSVRKVRDRRLRSELAFLWLPRDRAWMAFRDVIEVDGQPVTDRTIRLKQLLMEPGSTAEVRALADEGARFNIGDIARNFSEPTLVVTFLASKTSERFAFRKSAVESREDSVSWVIDFKETTRPTLIRNRHRSLPAEGKVWVEPESGRIVRTRLVIHDRQGDVHGEVDVAYRLDPRLEMWVPSEMVEDYFHPGTELGEHIEGRATYSNFRRFDTETRIIR